MRKDTDVSLVMRQVLELITKPCLGQWMLCVIWLREVVPLHPSPLLHPAQPPSHCHHNQIQCGRAFCKASSSSQLTSGPCKGGRMYAKHILWRHRISTGNDLCDFQRFP